MVARKTLTGFGLKIRLEPRRRARDERSADLPLERVKSGAAPTQVRNLRVVVRMTPQPS